MTELNLFTQVALEKQMHYGGVERAKAMMERADNEGRAADMPYAKDVFADYVVPIAEAIRAEVESSSAGSRMAHVSLLAGLDLEAVAFLAVRTAFSTLLGSKPENHRQLAYSLGKTVHQELLLQEVEHFSPELYQTLVRDLGRRLSRDTRHRVTVMRMQAQKIGMVIPEWPLGAREQVGMYLMSVLEAAEFIVLGEELREGYKRVARAVHLNPDIVDRIDQIKGYVSVTMPRYGACVEPPMDWVTPTDGGFHTPQLRRASPCLVRGRNSARELAAKTDMPVVLSAVNALQRTAWAVNSRLLDWIYKIAHEFSTKEIVGKYEKPKPMPPVWLKAGMKKEDMDEPQLNMFKAWKRQVADWHTERKLMSTRYARFYSATRSAEFYKAYPAIYFVHFADSRGRLYPMTNGLNPQGSDLGKALLHFAEGLPLDTPEAVRWFHVQGANKWGFDKATLAERHAWVVERQDELCSYADDPVTNRGWTEAGDPLQFLAWCLEYRDYVRDQDGSFVSHLPISMDGSCNGLQNLSAMFRDEIGGKATNLTDNVVMEDIYKLVAEAATRRMQAAVLEDPEKEAIRKQWLAHGITRKVTKRSVMTMPYGVTRMSATDYVISDYLTDTQIDHPFERTPKAMKAAANVLMGFVWPAIGDVVVKGQEAMAWLKRAARVIVKNFPEGSEPLIKWDTPSGFPACQAYFEEQVHRIRTRLHGEVRIRVLSETEEPDLNRHVNGLAPNFVHSMDAAHLHLTTAAASYAGIRSLAMIHDDYGTHAAKAQTLFEIIRRQFVAMYDMHDPVLDLCKRYDRLPMPPSRGTLNIHDVLRSQYFFS